LEKFYIGYAGHAAAAAKKSDLAAAVTKSRRTPAQPPPPVLSGLYAAAEAKTIGVRL